MNKSTVTESELHAHVDGLLPEARRAEVAAHLDANALDALRVREWQEQNRMLHELFDPVLAEPVPSRLNIPVVRGGMRRLMQYAAVVAWVAVGGVAGWYLHGYDVAKSADTVAFAQRAAIAHIVYSPEVRHPVEVGADQEAHLVAWLSKRIGGSLKVPQLATLGYNLVGGRLLPGNQGPVAQFMFQDGSGQRLTLYVRNGAGDGNANSRETAFRYARESGISVFYWVDGKFGYALSGDVEKADLLRVANVVYRQLNP
jgi:anti-sigma factor RsiW